MLVITNGSSITSRLAEDEFPATLLAWDDILYEGPVVATPDLPTLSDIRATYLALESYGDWDAISANFQSRDAVLLDWRSHEEVVLLFEHDLHDQLQLLQLLDFFARQPGLPETRLTMSCIDSFPGLDERFVGIGQLSVAQMRDVIAMRRLVTPEQIVLGRRLWEALLEPEPIKLASFGAEQCSALPFVHAALQRLLQELPYLRGGVSRTEWQILRVLAAGPGSATDLFYRTQELEDAPFHGDTTLFRVLRNLTAGKQAAAKFDGQSYSLTGYGRKLLAGTADWTHSHGLNRWVGGTHLYPENDWRWDDESQSIVQLPPLPR